MAAQIPVRGHMVGENRLATGEWIAFFRQLLADLEAVSGSGSGASIAASRLTGTIELARISGLTDAQVSALASIAWSKIAKAGSSLGDLESRSASDLTSGVLALAQGGAGVDLSATGGANQFLKQTALGALVSVAAILVADLPTAIPAANLADGSISDAEFQYLNGAVSNLQQQLNDRARHPVHRRSMWMTPVGASAGMTAHVMGHPTAATASGTIVEQIDASLIGGRQTTGAVSGNSVGLLGPAELISEDADPVFTFLFRSPPDITNIRFWIGAAIAAAGDNDDPSATNRYAMLRYSTVAGDTGFMGACGNAAGAQSVTAAAVAPIVAATVYLARVRFSGGGAAVHFSLNGSAEQTLSTNLPDTAGGTKLTWEHRLFTQAAAAKSWDWGASEVEATRVSTSLGNPV